MKPGDLDEAARMATDAAKAAERKHGKGYASWHEAWAVLREEVDELWDEVKLREQSISRIRLEAVDIAACALRIIAMAEERMRDQIRAKVTAVPFVPDDGFPQAIGYMIGPDDGKSTLYPTIEAAIESYLASKEQKGS
jgi:hypothetical protein